jgi:hypothetical protein
LPNIFLRRSALFSNQSSRMPNFGEQTIFPKPGIHIDVGMARFVQEAAGKAISKSFAKKFRVLLADWVVGDNIAPLSQPRGLR